VLPNYERKQRDLKFEVAGRDRLGIKRDKVCGSKSVGGSECVYTRNDVDRTVPGEVVRERRISSVVTFCFRSSFNFLTRYLTVTEKSHSYAVSRVKRSDTSNFTGARDSTKEIPNGFVEETVIRITRNASERITHEFIMSSLIPRCSTSYFV